MSSSWKFTKKFKETHLSSLTSFSKSTPSTSGSASEFSSSAANPGFDAKQSPTSSAGQPSLEALKPGILIVTLYEARGLSLPEQHQNAFSSQYPGDSDRPHSSSAHGLKGIPTNHGRTFGKHMPYALVDFDKVQIFVNSIDGNPENPFWAGSNTQYKFDVSRVSELTVHIFIRNPNAAPGSGRSQDIFLGAVRLHPSFDHGQSRGFNGVGWFDVQYGTGKIQLGVDYKENQETKLSIDDFELLKVIGKGSFGKVMQVRKKDTNRIYALKTIRKAKIISRSEVTHTMAERSVLAQINNPFIAPLKFSFQSPEKLYFVLAFVNGGELFHHLTLERRFDVNRSRFYTAELLCVLECLHGFNVIYRDLKPENILLDYQGHIALCDFGLCKLEMKDEDHTRTFCGTPEYLAPEILLGEGYNKTVDWWTLGVLLYEMLTGLPPFYDEVVNEMYRKILTQPLSFPGTNIVPPAAKDLLTKLLDRDPKQRLGANGVAEIKSHPFFHGIDWRKLLERKYDPSFKPNVTGALDTGHIDPIFTSEDPHDSYVDGPVLSQTIQAQFAGFSYNRPVAGLNDAGGSIKDPTFMDLSGSR
ncbi:AGC/AKT protein kinase [Mariannaea sp. PMI_226]|nr:AGC/AKT protein kinase [Mariannaea sp. PMI_226]